MDRKSRSAKDSATAKTIKKASPVGDDEEPPVQKKTNNSKLSEEKNSTKSGDPIEKAESPKKASAIDHRDKAGNETKRIELKKAESVGTEKDSEKPSSVIQGTKPKSPLSGSKQTMPERGKVMEPESDGSEEHDENSDEEPQIQRKPPPRQASKSAAQKTSVPDQRDRTEEPQTKIKGAAKIDTSKAILNMPSILLTDPEGKVAVISWIRDRFKINSEGKVLDKSWVFEVPVDYLSTWDKIVNTLDALTLSQDMPYDSPWEGTIKLPGQDDYIDFNMEQNDRGEWRLTIEQTTEIKTPNGVLFDEKKHTFYPEL